MTEQEARELLDEIRTVRPRKRFGRTLFELRPDGRLDVYTMNKRHSRMWFMYTTTIDDCANPVIREWARTR